MAWIIPMQNTPGIDLLNGDSLFVSRSILVGQIVNYGSNNKIIVQGSVASEGAGIYLLNGSGHYLKIEQSGDVRGFTGSGISAYSQNAKIDNAGYVFGAYQGIYIAGSVGVVTVNNSGTIESDDLGIARYEETQSVNVFNTGTIKGAAYAIALSFAGDTVNDTITNNGILIGTVDLGGGDDYFDGRSGRVDGTIYGGAGDDRIYVRRENNKLYGQEGNDTLMGGAGSDYLGGGVGTDRASYASASKGLIVSLANPTINTGDALGDTYNSIENLSGSNFNDLVYGNSAANAINGGAGNDVIKGYGGNDTLTGSSGNDTFNFNSSLSSSGNVDAITDYSVAIDTIQLDNLIFKSLAAGGLSSSAFRSNTTGLAGDLSDRIIYEKDTGEIYYDSNGTGSGGSVLFVKISIGLSMTNANFFVV
ncbi:hypothetical protein [Rhizobium sp. Leaf391]|uniref:calcium-binding protein n=1 Tax=Rhizobium sp. Leaf391 TaxID=1736360 RepID=UPI0009E6D534|nr:hypothetical protein [Rhizobium sp. Leaf391]